MPSGENVVTRDRMGIQMLDMLVRAKLPQSCPTLCAPVDCSRQAPLSMGFSRQEHWSGLPFPPPGGLPGPRSNLAGGFFTSSAAWEACVLSTHLQMQSVTAWR